MFNNCLEQRLIPLSNFLLVLREGHDLEQTKWYVWDKEIASSRPFIAELDHSDLKRDSILKNFFYLSMRFLFEGTNNEYEERKDEISKLMREKNGLVLLFKEVNYVQNF